MVAAGGSGGDDPLQVRAKLLNGTDSLEMAQMGDLLGAHMFKVVGRRAIAQNRQLAGVNLLGAEFAGVVDADHSGQAAAAFGRVKGRRGHR